MSVPETSCRPKGSFWVLAPLGRVIAGVPKRDQSRLKVGLSVAAIFGAVPGAEGDQYYIVGGGQLVELSAGAGHLAAPDEVLFRRHAPSFGKDLQGQLAQFVVILVGILRNMIARHLEGHQALVCMPEAFELIWNGELFDFESVGGQEVDRCEELGCTICSHLGPEWRAAHRDSWRLLKGQSGFLAKKYFTHEPKVVDPPSDIAKRVKRAGERLDSIGRVRVNGRLVAHYAQ